MSTALSRRAFLGGAAAAALGLSLTAVPRARADVTEERHRAVVIGSGFGGAITAMHLGRAGVQTLVLERGIRWPTGPNAETFPHMLQPDRRMSWLSPIPVMPGTPPVPTESFTGLIERIPGDGMDILCGAGVGGSSLAYHGMTLQPDGERFAQSVSSSIDYDRLDSDHYRRVERMLRVATIPDDVLGHERYRSSRAFLDRAEAEGYETFRVPMPIDWDFARREFTGELKPSYTTGDVIYGVNNGGKFSVDVTYLAAAEATGHVDVAEQRRPGVLGDVAPGRSRCVPRRSGVCRHARPFRSCGRADDRHGAGPVPGRRGDDIGDRSRSGEGDRQVALRRRPRRRCTELGMAECHLWSM
ncbi:hypothetical protein [Rhodococcus sp. SJ-2]